MIPSFIPYAALSVSMALTGWTHDSNRIVGEPNQKTPETLPLCLESVTGPTAIRLPSTTQWRGREYDIETGINVLMGVIRDRTTSVNDRQLALLDLSRLRTHLKGRPCLDTLARLYDNAEELEKKITLTCFLGSHDPRAVPLFIRVLDNDHNMKRRLCAASGLAGWNVRRGVAELVALVESKEVLPQPSRMPYVRDNALESFRNSNARKGWGFPEEQIRKSILSRPGLDRDKFVALYTAAIKKWFAENEHRFPDWKLGDPLPEVAAPEKRIPAEKRAEDK